MQGLELTDRVRMLLEEEQRLCPDLPISFDSMDNRPKAIRPGVAAAHTDASGAATVYLDPSRADEYVIAHEIMHLILHRSGCPQMFYLLPSTGRETLQQYIADMIDNCFDHYAFGPRLDSLGFDSRPYREWYVSEVSKWSAEKEQGPSILEKAIYVLDGLLFGEPYREELLRAAKNLRPRAVALGRNIERLVVGSERSNRVARKRAMIGVVEYLSRWITKQSG